MQYKFSSSLERYLNYCKALHLRCFVRWNPGYESFLDFDQYQGTKVEQLAYFLLGCLPTKTQRVFKT